MYTPIPQEETPETEVPLKLHDRLQIRPRGRSSSISGLPFWERWLQGYYTIVPESNPFLDAWDIIIILALSATAMVLPFEVAMIEEPPFFLNVADWAIDAIFTLDIIVTFNVAFTPYAARSTEVYQRRPIKIAQHYMALPFTQNLSAGWFWPDALTVVPWDSLTGYRNAGSVRFIRVLRLVRMLRLVRVVKLFKRWHTNLGFSFASVKVLRCLTMVLLMTHWLACVWAHIGKHSDEYLDGAKGWLSQTHLAERKDIHDFTSFEIYQLSLYFCAVVLTTVGFGDIVPLNQLEVSMMTCTIFLTGVTWTCFVANIVDVIANVDMYGVSFNHAMDDLNTLMDSHNVSHDLKRRIRRHLHEAYHVHRQRHHQDVIAWLSDGLQGELAVECGVEETCACIWYFRDVKRHEWMIDLAHHFKAEMYSPSEMIMTKHSVVVIRKGSCVRKGIVLLRDSVLGEDMILVSELLKDTAFARTINICEVMKLSRNGLVWVCEKHRDLNQRIRKAQVKLAVWRAFIFLAHKIKRHRLKSGTWDSYFDADRESEQQVLRNFWGAISKFARPGWVETLAKGTQQGCIVVPASPQASGTLLSKAELRNESAMVQEVRALREQLEEKSAMEQQFLSQISMRLEAVEHMPSKAVEQPPPIAASLSTPSGLAPESRPAVLGRSPTRKLKVFSTR